MVYCVVPTSLTNHSFPTDIFIKTVLVAQSLLKLELCLLYLHCMFLYFFMNFLNVLLCCSYFFNKPFISHRDLQQNNLSGSIPSEIGTLSSVTRLYVPLYFFMDFLNVLLLFLLLQQTIHFPTDIFMVNNLGGSIPSEIGSLSSLQYLYVSLFFHGFPKCFIVLSHTSLTNHSFPTDIFIKTILVAQSLLKSEPFLQLYCMFLYFFMNFLSVLLCCPFFNKLSVFSLFSHFLSSESFVRQPMIFLEPFQMRFAMVFF